MNEDGDVKRLILASEDEDSGEDSAESDLEQELEKAVAAEAVEGPRAKNLASTTCIICMEDEPIDLSVTPCGKSLEHAYKVDD